MFVKKNAMVVLFLFLFLTNIIATEERLDERIGEGLEQESTWVTSGRAAADSVFGWMYQEGTCDDRWTNTIGIGIYSNTILVIFTVAMGILLVYLLGTVMQSPGIIATAKDQGFQLIIPLIQVGILMAATAGGNMWTQMTPTAGLDDNHIYDRVVNPTTIDSAMAFSRLMIFKMTSDYTFLLFYNMIIHTIYSSTLWFGFTWRAMYTFNMGPILKPLIDIMGSALQFMSIGIGEWIFHLITLCMIKKWSWGLFIPLGWILVAIPYTRGAGGALLGLMFAFVFIYPLMFLVNYEIYNITSSSLVSSESAVTSFINNSGILGFGAVILIAALFLGAILSPFLFGAAISVAIELVRSSVYYIVIMSLVLPFINIFVTLTAAKEIGKMFGANVNFMEFMRLI